MNFDEELKKLLDAIKAKGIFTIIFGIAVFIIALGSIGEVTSSIIEIRGLVKDGLDLHRAYLVNPIINAGKYVRLNFTSDEINAAILGSITISAILKVLTQGQRVAFDEINRIHESNMKPEVWHIYALCYFGISAMWTYYGLVDSTGNMLRAMIIFIIAPAIVVLTKYVATHFDHSYFEREKYSYAKSYYVFLVKLFTVLLILIAVSNGFTQEIKN